MIFSHKFFTVLQFYSATLLSTLLADENFGASNSSIITVKNIMPQIKHLRGYDACKQALNDSKNPLTYVLFCGSKNAAGESWCPDCVKAEPVVEECAKELPDDALFIHCDVGERTFWKDQSNPFRTDPDLKLSGVPTLIQWKSSKKLVEEDCQKKDLVAMLFED